MPNDRCSRAEARLACSLFPKEGRAGRAPLTSRATRGCRLPCAEPRPEGVGLLEDATTVELALLSLAPEPKPICVRLMAATEVTEGDSLCAPLPRQPEGQFGHFTCPRADAAGSPKRTTVCRVRPPSPPDASKERCSLSHPSRSLVACVQKVRPRSLKGSRFALRYLRAPKVTLATLPARGPMWRVLRGERRCAELVRPRRWMRRRSGACSPTLPAWPEGVACVIGGCRGVLNPHQSPRGSMKVRGERQFHFTLPNLFFLFTGLPKVA